MPNKLLEDFNKSKELLFEHVGYEEDGSNYPVEDGFDYYYWKIDGQTLLYAENKEDLIYGQHYSLPIYEDHYYPQSIFRGEDLTMIILLFDMEKTLLLLFLDNEKEIK